jgi:hypothetical protein
MKKLVLILLLLTPVWAFTQTHTFTEKEVVEMDSLFQVYEQTDSLQKLEINLLVSVHFPEKFFTYLIHGYH